MPPKQLLFDMSARKALKAGVDSLANAVRITLGPKGRNVVLEKKFGVPLIINDGVTIAREIELKDPFENLGAQLVKEVAIRTNDVAGDGTTTATVLAQAIVREGMRNVAAGANPMGLKRGLDRSVRVLVEELRRQARPVQTKSDIEAVASIAADNSEIGALIAEVMEKVGKDGVITVEESKGIRMETDFVDGMQWDRGYISPYFVTNPERMEASLDDPYILITDSKISSINEIVPVMERALQMTKNFVIISEDVDGEALATLVVNKLRGTINVLAVKAPGFGDRRKAMLEDLAILTGGTAIIKDMGRTLEQAQVADLGRARRLVSLKDSHHHRGGRRHRRGDPEPPQGDQGADRRHHLGLRPGETARTAGAAGRRGGRDQGRRPHRSRAQREKGQGGGRPQRHPRRRGRGDRGRRRGGAAARVRRAG